MVTITFVNKPVKKVYIRVLNKYLIIRMLTRLLDFLNEVRMIGLAFLNRFVASVNARTEGSVLRRDYAVHPV